MTQGPNQRVGYFSPTRRAFLAGGIGLVGSTLINAACGSSTKPAGSDLGAVEHVVFLMQENRSFDHYFGTYPGVRGFDDRPATGLGNFAQAWPQGPSAGATLLPINLKSAAAQLCPGNASVPIHDWGPQHDSWDNGTNSQFVAVHSEAVNDGTAQGPLVMGYFTREQLPYYYALADAYTICDNYFCSVMGPTMPNRLYSMSAFLDPAGTHGGPVLETPGFAEAAHAVGSVSWDTMPEVLEDHGVSWKIYQPPGTSVGASIKSNLATGFSVMLYFSQYLKDPKSPIYQKAFLPSWPNEFLADVKAGTLPSVSWILPPIAYSEHPNGSPLSGQWFSSQVISALQSNSDLWSKTVLFLNYDENGGFFDHVVPPVPPQGTAGEFVTASSAGRNQGTHIGAGFRVPMTVVSPFSAGGWIDSTRYDHTSVLRFLESRFGAQVPNLTAWRRQTVGDLTTALGFNSPDDRKHTLPATAADSTNGCPSPTNLVPFLTPPERLTIPHPQSMPSQEPGTAKRRRST